MRLSGLFLKVGTGTTKAAPKNPGFLGFFVHNSLVFLLWALGGAVTFGLVAVVCAGFSTLYNGLIIGVAIQEHGIGQLLFLGHGLLEVPAFAIGLYLGVKPLLMSIRIRMGHKIHFVSEVLSGFTIWVLCALVFLAGAAVWERIVEFA